MLESLGLAAGTIALAGCSGGSDDSGSDDDSSESEQTDDNGETGDNNGGSNDGSDDDSDQNDGSDDNGNTGSEPTGDVDREIYVEADSFSFTPGSDEPIVVQQGETIEMTATALDNGIGQGHGLGIIGYPDATLEPLYKDEEKTTTFVADEAGEFQMYCTIQCSQPNAGQGHSNMLGTFIVE